MPAWAALGIPVGTVADIAGFAAGSVGLLVVSALILLVALAPTGVRLLAANERALAPSGRPAPGLH
jgi:hypothetical protein